MRVEVNQEDINRLKSDLRHIKNGMPLVVMRSINRVLTGVRTDFVNSVRREYNVKAAAARGNITIHKASKNNISGAVESTGRPIPLVNFAPRPSNVQPRRKKAITVEVIRGERKPLENAFIALMPKKSADQKKQHKGIFRRHKPPGKDRVGRLPIGELWGPRLEDYYSRSDVQAELQSGAERRLSVEIDRQADYLFRQRMGML